jgi:hypothetical protein
MSDSLPSTEDLARVDLQETPPKGWMDTPAQFRPGTWSYPGAKKHVEYLGLPNARTWSPSDENWKLPPDWKERILHNGMKESAWRSSAPSGCSWTSACAAAPAPTSATSSSAPATPRTCRCFSAELLRIGLPEAILHHSRQNHEDDRPAASAWQRQAT